MQDTEQNMAQPILKKQKSISLIWFIPLVALALGAWLVYKNKTEKGPIITIQFENAAGIEAGSTKIKYKDVDIGIVENIELNTDLESVIISARLDKETRPYLNENTKFWIVKPRIGTGGVSGLNTLLSGAYIGIDASEDGASARDFIGLERPPIINSNAPGVEIILHASDASSLVVGSPVYYKSFIVGKVQTVELVKDFANVQIKAFIEAPYDKLVTEKSSFWNVSGISAKVSADGIEVSLQSLESLLIGGIAFDSPAGLKGSEAVSDGALFSLYESAESVGTEVYTEKVYFILNFDQSIRGLTVGAPVEFKGYKIGQVLNIHSKYDKKTDQIYLPILIEIEPERLGPQFQLSSIEEDSEEFRALIKRGFRAKLQTGSLITGQLYVAVDFDKDARAVEPQFFDGYPQIPTISTDLGKITQNISEMMDKINSLELDKLAGNLNQVMIDTSSAIVEVRKLVKNTDHQLVDLLDNLDQTLNSTKSLLESVDEKSITRYSLDEMFKEVTQAARSIRVLTETLEENPNAIIFGKSLKEEP